MNKIILKLKEFLKHFLIKFDLVELEEDEQISKENLINNSQIISKEELGEEIYNKKFNTVFVSQVENTKIQELKTIKIVQRENSEIMFIDVQDIKTKSVKQKKYKVRGSITNSTIERIMERLYNDWLNNRQAYQYIVENPEENIMIKKTFYNN